MATTRLFESTGEGGGQGYAHWAGQSSVTGPHIFTGSGLSTASESQFAGGVAGQASNSYIGGNGNDGLVRLRWPVDASGNINTVPSSGPIKFSDIARLGKLPQGTSISIGNYFNNSVFLPAAFVAGGTPPTQPSPGSNLTASSLRGLYIDVSDNIRTSLRGLTVPAYVNFIAIRAVGASGGGGGGDLSISAGEGGRPLSVDGIYNLNLLTSAAEKIINYEVGSKGLGGTKTTGAAGSGGVGYTDLANGGDGGRGGLSGISGAGGGGGAATVVEITNFANGQTAYFIAGGGGGGGGAARLVNSVTKNGNSIGTGGTLTTNLQLALSPGTSGDNYGPGDGGGCGGGGGGGGEGGRYVDPPETPEGVDTGGYQGCLAYGTLIAMFDGTLKPVEQLIVGDIVKSLAIQGLSQDETTHWDWNSLDWQVSESMATVKQVKLGLWYRYCDINEGFLKLTNDHRLLVRRDGTYSFIPAGLINVGDSLYHITGEWIEVFSHKRINENLQVVDFDVEDEDVYFANGVLSHNFPDGSPSTK